MKTLKGDPHAIALFTNGEKKQLKRILAEYPSKNVQIFILQVQFICLRVLLYRENIETLKYKKPSITNHKAQLKESIEKLESASEVLDKIQTGKLNARRHYTLDDLGPLYPTGKGYSMADDPIMGTNITAGDVAHEALEKITELLSILKNARNDLPDGKTHGTIDTELAEQIREAYQKFLGKPDSSMNTPFPSILQILFKAVGKELKWPEKLAKKIL